MKGGVPEGWVATTLGPLIESMKNGIYKPVESYTNDGVACLRMYNIQGGKVVWRDIKRMKLTRNEVQEYGLHPGDLLVNRVNSRELVGKSAVVPKLEPCVFESKNIRVRVRREVVYPEFANYCLLLNGSNHFTYNAQQVVGMASISQPQIAAFPLLLPPLAEQHRIVAQIEAILAKARSSRERLAKIPNILKRFRQAALEAACSGRLTADWREATGLKLEEWKNVRASEVCEAVECGSTPDKASFQSAPGIPFLKVYNIVNQRVDFEYRPQYVNQATHSGRLRRSSAKPNDVLMNIVGPPLGKVAIVPATHNEWNINQAIVLFRVGPQLRYRFLYYLLYSGIPYQEVLEETRGSAGQSNISLSQCRNILVAVPTLAEQEEIIRRIESLFALADRLEARYLKAKLHVDKLTQSVLAKGFRGELVPTEAELARREGRSYETAEELLARIKMECAPPAGVRRTRQNGARR